MIVTKTGFGVQTTLKKIEALRCELEVWFKSNEFLRGLIWRTTTQLRYGDDDSHPIKSYFVTLKYVDSSFRDIVSGLPTAEPMHSLWLGHYEKFDAILAKHGFWSERINDVSLSIFENE